ncbi:MAG: hypothetical protein QOE77_2001 [Blastocatellia bacterium]|jgi:uncharacterized protein involved in exopolysaccharide biosynthesis|nr:hypothetical protein [Blastocatellia bacterium]
MKKFLAVLALTIAASFVAAGFTRQSAAGQANDPKSTPAYEVMVLRKVAVESEFAELSSRFTESSPAIEANRFELNAIVREMRSMQMIEGADVAKLSGGYGHLVLRKVALEVELDSLLRSYTPQHPDVNKKTVEINALQRELSEMLK